MCHIIALKVHRFHAHNCCKCLFLCNEWFCLLPENNEMDSPTYITWNCQNIGKFTLIWEKIFPRWDCAPLSPFQLHIVSRESLCRRICELVFHYKTQKSSTLLFYTHLHLYYLQKDQRKYLKGKSLSLIKNKFGLP